MKKILSLSILAVAFTMISCKEEKKAPEGPTQMQRVIAIHDEVMPEMDKIGKLVGELKSKVDTTEVGQQYESAMKDLQDAHATMMDWMKDFGFRFDHGEIMEGKELTEEKQKWLDEEEVKVQEVKDKINNSIAQAEALLAKEN